MVCFHLFPNNVQRFVSYLSSYLYVYLVPVIGILQGFDKCAVSRKYCPREKGYSFFTGLLQCCSHSSYYVIYWTTIRRKEVKIDQPVTQVTDTGCQLLVNFCPRQHGSWKSKYNRFQKGKIANLAWTVFKNAL